MNRRFFGSAVIGAVASLFGIKTAKAAVEREEVGWAIQYTNSEMSYMGGCFFNDSEHHYNGPCSAKEIAKRVCDYYKKHPQYGMVATTFPVYK